MATTTYEQIRAEQRDDVLLLTLNRPERLNAWTPRMSAELTHAILGANDDPSVGAIVVTGEGRGFCAGADIGGQFAQNLDDDTAAKPAAEPAPERLADWVTLCRESKPLVAALNGPTIGVGLTMVLPFDRLVAARSAKLSARFVKMGIVPELASSHFLVARCGWGAASWLTLSGATILGDEAAAMRLIDRVVDDGEALDAALADARLLAENPPAAVRAAKRLLTENASETDLRAVQRREMEALEVQYRSPEHHEAVRAFLEKRAPDFRNLAR
jgi:2-(1,2-epoxy-1,2-dihydrophenyl)acetyl-CoA isomerase